MILDVNQNKMQVAPATSRINQAVTPVGLPDGGDVQRHLSARGDVQGRFGRRGDVKGCVDAVGGQYSLSTLNTSSLSGELGLTTISIV